MNAMARYSRKDLYCKAHPDEKGIETIMGSISGNTAKDCKAHPDEKGIETQSLRHRSRGDHSIAKLIPTKRELKPDSDRC